ncbi:MAG: flagellar filament capping protein FliD [Bacteroidales bacterium]
MSATSMVSGLASGLDWKNIIDQLRKIEYKKVDLIENQKKVYEEKVKAWQSINKKLLSLKTASQTLNRSKHFNLFKKILISNTTTDADDILSVNPGDDASPGTYQIKVNSLAYAQKISSSNFASKTLALNLSGDIIIGGRTVKISTSDNLSTLRDKINAVNSGNNASKVTASIIYYSGEGYRLILTSDLEGSSGISLLNGGPSNLLGELGFVDSSEKNAKNIVNGGHKSDAFSDSEGAIGGTGLLNLTNPQSGIITITISGVSKSVTIDLANDSLRNIKDSINSAFSGVFSSNPASIITETDKKGNTYYRLLIEGNEISYIDSNNILETLGILKRGGFSDERGVTGDISNTSGGNYITLETLIKEIDGYNDYSSGDTIEFSGIDTFGNTVNYSFQINDLTTIGDLLTAIENQYGSVRAQITEDGRVRIIDNEIGDTDLSVILTPSKSSIKFDSDHNFGTLSTIRARQIQVGADANFTIDGVEITTSSNTINDIIPGVSLQLKKASSDTTVTLTLVRDYDSILDKIKEFVKAYNEVMEAIDNQLKYNKETEEQGGPLFGDNNLRLIKSNLIQIILNKITGLSDNFSSIGLIGINIGTDSKLTIDEDTLNSYLETNFDDVRRLFVADWSSTRSDLSYIYHTIDTRAGTYEINIDSIEPMSGYFVTEGDASGNGEFLTGISGNAKGLVIKYSGEDIGKIGSLTLTYGIAELIDRLLYKVTDSIDGTISVKIGTIQETIKDLNSNIENMEIRIERKMAELERQFIAMETALSTLQSQMNWLAKMFKTNNL